MPTKLPLAALLLLAACTKSPEERAHANALHMLRHELGAAGRPDSASLKVYDFPQSQVRYFTSEVATYDDGHLVTFDLLPGAPRPGRRAVFVANNDSAFFFIPFQHQAEFAQRYGVPALPTP